MTQFEVDGEYAKRFPVQVVGGRQHEELWVPAEELDEFNRHIVGKIKIVAAYYGERFTEEIDPETNLPNGL